VSGEPVLGPSKWLLRHRDALRETAALGPVADLACGRGRHALACSELGLACLAVDRDAASLRLIRDLTRDRSPAPWTVRADLEAECGIPIAEGSCGAILIFRFLYRPLAAAVCRALAPGGLLLYETFTVDQCALGWGPRTTTFLLAEGELPKLFSELEIVAYEEGVQPEADPGARAPAATARLAARRPRR
jgi:SAM-dependent methyltransferase